MYIDGEWRSASGGKSFEVLNPADGAVIGTVPDGDAADAGRAIEAAERAFAPWSRTTAYFRADILQKAHRLMLERNSWSFKRPALSSFCWGYGRGSRGIGSASHHSRCLSASSSFAKFQCSAQCPN